MEKEFYLTKYAEWAKELEVIGGKELRLGVDFDDVDRLTVSLDLKKMLYILNDNWNNPKYEFLNKNPYDLPVDANDYTKGFDYDEMNDPVKHMNWYDSTRQQRTELLKSLEKDK